MIESMQRKEKAKLLKHSKNSKKHLASTTTTPFSALKELGDLVDPPDGLNQVGSSTLEEDDVVKIYITLLNFRISF
jgi:hypothetical protein